MTLTYITILLFTVGIILGILQRKQNAPVWLYIVIGILLASAPAITYFSQKSHLEFPTEITLIWALSGVSIFLSWPFILKCNRIWRICISIPLIIIICVVTMTLNKDIDVKTVKPESSIHEILYTVAQAELNKALGAEISNGVPKQHGYYKIGENPLGLMLLANTKTPANEARGEFKTQSVLRAFLDKNVKITKIVSKSNDKCQIYKISGNVKLQITITFRTQHNGGIWKIVRVLNPSIELPMVGTLEISKEKTLFTKIGMDTKNSR
jgi:hypothetical protein